MSQQSGGPDSNFEIGLPVYGERIFSGQAFEHIRPGVVDGVADDNVAQPNIGFDVYGQELLGPNAGGRPLVFEDPQLAEFGEGVHLPDEIVRAQGDSSENFGRELDAIAKAARREKQARIERFRQEELRYSPPVRPSPQEREIVKSEMRQIRGDAKEFARIMAEEQRKGGSGLQIPKEIITGWGVIFPGLRDRSAWELREFGGNSYSHGLSEGLCLDDRGDLWTTRRRFIGTIGGDGGGYNLLAVRSANYKDITTSEGVNSASDFRESLRDLAASILNL